MNAEQLAALARDEVVALIRARSISPDDAVRWFHLEPVAHAESDRILKLLTQWERTPADMPIKALIGETRVGKTTTMGIARNVINFKHREAMTADPLLLPAILAEIQAVDGERLGPEASLGAWLNEVGAPPVTGCLPPAEPRSRQSWTRRVNVEQPMSERVISMSRPRGLRVAFLDEGRHMVDWDRDTRTIRRHFNRLKSIANSLDVIIVVAMAYDGLDLWDLEPQLLQRVEPIHFRRYTASAEDQFSFGGAFRALVARLPLDTPFDDGDVPYFYGMTVGCVGMLAQWLGRALRLAVDRGEAMTLEDVQATVTPWHVVVQTLQDAQVGERHPWLRSVEPDATEWNRHMAALGFEVSNGTVGPAPSDTTVDTGVLPVTARTSRARRRRVPRAIAAAHSARGELRGIHRRRHFEVAARRLPLGMTQEDLDAAS